MPQTSPEPRNRLVKSPAVSPGKPLSLRRESGELETYIDMYDLSNDARQSDTQAYQSRNQADDMETQQFLFSGDVAQEMRNLQQLKRLSLDVSSFDPDVPPSNYDIAPAIQPTSRSGDADDDDGDHLGNSLYWVPARIHPELAPQEWQSFVQKRDGKLDGNILPAVRPIGSRSLSRSKSLLSREINERSADKYTDAGPLLEKRRSTLKPQLKVSDLENLQVMKDDPEVAIDGLPAPAEHHGDAPILIPPPGQILRRAARTGKAKLGSSRRLGRNTAPSVSPTKALTSEQASSSFDSERIQLYDEVPKKRDDDLPTQATETQSSMNDNAVDGQKVERKKSRNRTIQILGAKSMSDSAEPLKRTPDHFEGEWLGVPGPRDDTADVVEPANQNVSAEAIVLRQASPHKARDEVTKPDLSTQPDGNLNNPIPTNGPPAVSKDNPPARPGLRRELSAASLTRAVMSGTAPAPAIKSPPLRANTDSIASEQASSSKKSAWGKLFSSDDKSKAKKDKPVTKLKRSTSNEEHQTLEKDNASVNLFSSIFGKKKEKDTSSTENVKRSTTPTNHHTSPLTVQPHHFSRFPIQLERAIYRMAHLKLGNSRRPLAHQVLLSNFMYGYLALVGAHTSGQASGPSNSRSRPQSPNHRQSPRDRGQPHDYNSTTRQSHEKQDPYSADHSSSQRSDAEMSPDFAAQRPGQEQTARSRQAGPGHDSTSPVADPEARSRQRSTAHRPQVGHTGSRSSGRPDHSPHRSSSIESARNARSRTIET